MHEMCKSEQCDGGFTKLKNRDSFEKQLQLDTSVVSYDTLFNTLKLVCAER